jgi:hypothetical protein
MLSAISKYIVPSFLQRFDRYLLVNHPHLWRTRGHYFSFYTLIAAILLFAAGYFYPQTLHDLASNRNRFHNELPFFVTAFFVFLSITVVFGGWYYIQKFQYNRVKWNHLGAEISIYTLCLSLLWASVFAFLIGYQYRTAYHIEKNIEPNRQWLNDNNFFKAAYIPHYQLNKLDDLNLYFKQGDSLMQLIKVRFENLKQNGFFKANNGEEYYSYENFEYFEYLTPPPYRLLPASYPTFAAYYQAILGGQVSLEPAKRPFFTGSESVNSPNFVGKMSPYLSAPAYQALITQLHPNWYRYIDVSYSHQAKWRNLFEKWAAQKAFLAQLSTSEQQLYLNYLKYLRNNLPTQLAPSMEYLVFELLKKQFSGKQRSQIGLLATEDYASKPQEALNDRSDVFVLGAEQALAFIKSLSVDKKILYAHYAQLEYEPINYTHHSDETLPVKTKSLNYLKKQRPNATLQDSILYFDTYFSKELADITPIFQAAYAQYFVGKYSAGDLKRFETILKDNGFSTKNTDWAAAQQNLFLLQQGTILEKALSELPNKQSNFKQMRLMLYGLFSVICCILAAIVFYIMTISNGIQFWTGIFIGGFGMIFIGFLLSISGLGSNQLVPMILVCIHLLLFTGLILSLFFSKYQWQNARQIANSILFSGVISVGFASLLMDEYVRKLRQRDFIYNSLNSLNRLSEDLFIFANVIVIAIFIYLIIAYLLKRHLSLPKKH